MKARFFLVIRDGKAVETMSCSDEVELEANEIPATSNEVAIIHACDGDLELAENIIRDLRNRIAKVGK